MFCGKCGAENLDGAVFCKECGASLNGSGKSKGAAVPKTANGKRDKKIGILVVVAAVVVVIILLAVLLGGRNYQETVEEYLDAQLSANMGAVMELIPDEVIDYMLAREGYSREDFDILLAEATEDVREQLDAYDNHFGTDWEVSYQILRAVETNEEELAELQAYYDAIGVEVSDAKTVEVELTVQGSQAEMSDTMDIDVMKSGRSWYLDVQNLGGLF